MTISKRRELWRQASRRHRKRHYIRVRDRLRKWQAANREKCRAYAQKWRAENPDKVKVDSVRQRTFDRPAYLAMRHKSNIKTREKRRKYNLRRSKEMRSYRKKFYRNHIERWDGYNLKRRVAKAQTRFTNSELVDAIYRRARELREWFDVCVDHIIPLSKGGNHIPSNLQIIYASENLKKASRLDYKARVVFL